jgi:hypothetical protein
VDEILAGGFSTPPLSPLPAAEEFYNGALESNNGATDDPSIFTAVVAGAGSTVSNINIIFNRLAPGPIPAGDDTTHEIFPSFPLRMCGQTFNSFFVNSNGNLTFGAGSTDFSETIADHLTGPIRLAGLWDDLNPAAGGSVSWSENAHSVTVTFTNVPEFVNTGLLSRLLVQIPANGTFAVAVSTFGDVDFTGAGTDFGRYVLNISSYRGTLLPLTDDESVQVNLNTFAFPYQGANRTSVFVNGNGNLTFGAGDGDFSESVPEFLAGAPRIAPLWDDLFPGNGLVIGEINMNYLATNRSDAIVGVTQGGGAADPGPTNLSNASNLSAVGTRYEQFLGSFFDYH